MMQTFLSRRIGARGVVLGLGLLLLMLPSAVRAGDEDRSGWQKMNYHLGAGYTEETHKESPDGAVGIQGGGSYEFHPDWDIGLAGGYYWLGEIDFVDREGRPDTGIYSVIPIFAHARYNLAPRGSTNFYLTGGGGLYIQDIKGDVDCEDCRKFGLNFGGGIFSRKAPNRVGYGVEGRFHFIPEEDDAGREGRQFLSVLATLFIP